MSIYVPSGRDPLATYSELGYPQGPGLPDVFVGPMQTNPQTLFLLADQALKANQTLTGIRLDAVRPGQVELYVYRLTQQGTQSQLTVHFAELLTVTGAGPSQLTFRQPVNLPAGESYLAFRTVTGTSPLIRAGRGMLTLRTELSNLPGVGSPLINALRPLRGVGFALAPIYGGLAVTLAPDRLGSAGWPACTGADILVQHYRTTGQLPADGLYWLRPEPESAPQQVQLVFSWQPGWALLLVARFGHDDYLVYTSRFGRRYYQPAQLGEVQQPAGPYLLDWRRFRESKGQRILKLPGRPPQLADGIDIDVTQPPYSRGFELYLAIPAAWCTSQLSSFGTEGRHNETPAPVSGAAAFMPLSDPAMHSRVDLWADN